mmetsp:Transcript_15885/g.40636  ORF Transcript_15885/g.40636 Transcript_15885/m.40636 type:complete len:210 (-) Transcript_15885:377-1006(-)
MAGASAVMAVTPQMLVPAAVREPRRAGSPRRALSQSTEPRPAAMEAATTGTPAAPSFITSTALSLAPTHTMPACSTALEQKRRPGCSTGSAETGSARLLMPRPSRMATGTAEIGLGPSPRPCAAIIAPPSHSAPTAPTCATAPANARPGRIFAARVRNPLLSPAGGGFGGTPPLGAADGAEEGEEGCLAEDPVACRRPTEIGTPPGLRP